MQFQQKRQPPYYEEQVYFNRRIDRAHEYDLVAKWHGAYVLGNSNFENKSTTGFRREPDTGWPTAHEHAAIAPQKLLDPLMTALRPTHLSKSLISNMHDPTGRLFAEPMRTFLQ